MGKYLETWKWPFQGSQRWCFYHSKRSEKLPREFCRRFKPIAQALGNPRGRRLIRRSETKSFLSNIGGQKIVCRIFSQPRRIDLKSSKVSHSTVERNWSRFCMMTFLSYMQVFRQKMIFILNRFTTSSAEVSFEPASTCLQIGLFLNESWLNWFDFEVELLRELNFPHRSQ